MQKILIAEDDNIMQDFYEVALGDRYELFIVEDSNLALEKLSSSHFDLFITDLDMPNWDGNTAVSGAMAIDNTLPVIIASGYIGQPDFDSVSEIFPNIAGILKKPFQIDELISVIEKALKDQKA